MFFLIYLKVDIGMGCIGFCIFEEVKEVVVFIRESCVLEWEGLFIYFFIVD